ncbi:MAG: hypothetical protein GQE15_17980 [Archangiaceae bacterium]|nr:hypothetical protein [Archangiaceae bacterium]
MLLRVVVVVSLVASSSCKKSPPPVDPAFESAATAVKARLAMLPRIKQAVDATPRLSADTLALPGGRKASATLVTVEQLTSLGACFSDAPICDDFWWRLSRCEQLSQLAPAAATDFDTISEVKRCAALQYVAVARQRAFTAPAVDKASKTYRPGHLSVELLVFDLETGAALGGFIVDAKSPPSLDGMSAQTNVEKYLHTALGRIVFDAMRARIDT